MHANIQHYIHCEMSCVMWSLISWYVIIHTLLPHFLSHIHISTSGWGHRQWRGGERLIGGRGRHLICLVCNPVPRDTPTSSYSWLPCPLPPSPSPPCFIISYAGLVVVVRSLPLWADIDKSTTFLQDRVEDIVRKIVAIRDSTACAVMATLLFGLSYWTVRN